MNQAEFPAPTSKCDRACVWASVKDTAQIPGNCFKNLSRYTVLRLVSIELDGFFCIFVLTISITFLFCFVTFSL